MRLCTIRRPSFVSQKSRASVTNPTQGDPNATIIEGRSIALTAMLLLGAALALAALPSFFRLLPNDLERYHTILQELATTQCDVVVFGDSRGEADIRNLKNAVNASAHGVTLAEVRMFMQAVPASVKTIVIVLGRDRLSFEFFPRISYNAIAMYGLRPNDETRRDLADAFGSAAIDRTSFAHVLESRWTIKQSLDLLLHGPDAPPQRLSEERFRRAAALVKYDIIAAGTLDAAGHKLLAQIGRVAAARHQRVLLVVPPLHPAVLNGRTPAPLAPIPNVDVLDATTGFDDADFADPLHLTPAGAEKLTTLVAQRIEAMR